MSVWESMRSSSAPSAAVAAALLLIGSHAAVAGPPPPASGNAFVQTNLVSDLAGVAAVTDPNLINPWGISASATSPMWIADNGTGLSTLYSGAGAVIPLVVTIPPPAGGMGPAAPTGTVFNTTTQFPVNGTPAKFLFSTEDGTISGWNGGATAVLVVDNSASGAVYKGLALGAAADGGPLLYATNFHAGTVDIFDGTFKPVIAPGNFTDWSIPSGYAPFGIMTTPDNFVIVTYALQDSAMHDDVAGYGHGYVDEFDVNGAFVKRLVSGGALDSPWGLAIAPSGFGDFSGALLVGNFGDGRINAYDLAGETGASRPALRASIQGRHEDGIDFDFFSSFGGLRLLDTLRDSTGHPLTNLGLWALHFGSGSASGGAATSLYFTAGIPGSVGTLDVLENHGLFGVINPYVPTAP